MECCKFRGCLNARLPKKSYCAEHWPIIQEIRRECDERLDALNSVHEQRGRTTQMTHEHRDAFRRGYAEYAGIDFVDDDFDF